MQNNVIFFDGVCNLCSSSVQWIILHDKREMYKYSSLQSGYAATVLADIKPFKADSIILMQDGKFYQKSTAALKIAFRMNFPYNLLSVFLIVPRPIRDFVYDIIARNRYRWFGKKQACWLPDEHLKSKFIE